MALAVLFAPPTASHAQTASQIPRREGGEVTIVVPLDRSAPIEETFDIYLDKELAEFFPPGNPVIWEPEAQQDDLTSAFKDESFGKQLPRLTMGVEATSGAQVVINYDAEPLNQPRQYRLSIPNPQALRAGIYEGEVVFRIETFRPKGFVMHWVPKVRLCVLGREIVDARFLDMDPRASQPRLEVGRTPSLETTILSVGQGAGLGVGDGRLTLLWKANSESAASAARILEIPQPFPDEPADVAIDLPDHTAPFCAQPVCLVDEWQNEFIHGLPVVEMQTSSLPRKIDASQAIEAHAYKVVTRLPALDRTGALQADLVWRRGDEAEMAEVTASTPMVAIAPGITVLPTQAIAGEIVRVLVRTDVQLDSVIPLVWSTAAGQNPQSVSAELVPADRVTALAPPFAYEAQFIAPEIGTYRVRLATTASPLQKEALATAVGSFSVDFEELYELGDPIVTYAGTEPIWWGLMHDEPASYGTRRREAYRVRAAPGVGLAKIAFKTLTRDGRRLEEVREPEIRLRPSSSPAGSPPAESVQGPDGPSAPPGLPDGGEAASGTSGDPEKTHPEFWDVLANELALDFEVALDPKDEDQERNAAGIREYVLRLNFHGTGRDGEPLFRVVDIPFRLQVKAWWEDYVPVFFVGGVLFAGTVAILILNKIMSPKRRRKTGGDGLGGSLEPQLTDEPISEDGFAAPPPPSRPRGTPKSGDAASDATGGETDAGGLDASSTSDYDAGVPPDYNADVPPEAGGGDDDMAAGGDFAVPPP